jgi:hypothetical protein
VRIAKYLCFAPDSVPAGRVRSIKVCVLPGAVEFLVKSCRTICERLEEASWKKQRFSRCGPVETAMKNLQLSTCLAPALLNTLGAQHFAPRDRARQLGEAKR